MELNLVDRKREDGERFDEQHKPDQDRLPEFDQYGTALNDL